MQVIIERFCSCEEMGTFGHLKIVDDVSTLFESYTVERPWLNNEPFKSCIPCGTYELEEHSGKYGETYAIVGNSVVHWPSEIGGEKTRYTCVFHLANTYLDVVGCIGQGEKLGFLKGKWAVSNSEKTVEKFLSILKSSKEKHTLVIKNIDY